MNAWAPCMEKKYPRRAFISNDEDANSVARSQLRKRFELGGDTTSTTQPNVVRNLDVVPRIDSRGDRSDRKTTRPKAEDSRRDVVTSENGAGPNERPTIPTPRPRISLGAVPRRLVDERAMMTLPLDHRAAFVLMSIDGKTAIRSLIDVTGMAPDEVLVLVERLVELKAIALL